MAGDLGTSTTQQDELNEGHLKDGAVDNNWMAVHTEMDIWEAFQGSAGGLEEKDKRTGKLSRGE